MSNESDKVIEGLWNKFKDIIGDELSEATINTVRGLMHVMFPFNYEYYVSAFELVDSSGRPVMYFQFPLNPSSISVGEQRAHEINRTFSSVNVTDSDTFVPTNINISGNFGRQLKVMAMNKSGKIEIGQAAAMMSKAFAPDSIQNTYRARKWSKMFGANALVMTGYGAIKMMQVICSCDTLTSPFDNKPYKLIFHNSSAGDSTWVKVKDFQMTQSLDSNMVWNYSIQLDGICPAEYVLGIWTKKRALKMLAVGMVNKAVNSVAKKVLISVATSNVNVKKIMNSKAIQKAGKVVSTVGKTERR